MFAACRHFEIGCSPRCPFVSVRSNHLSGLCATWTIPRPSIFVFYLNVRPNSNQPYFINVPSILLHLIILARIAYHVVRVHARSKHTIYYVRLSDEVEVGRGNRICRPRSTGKIPGRPTLAPPYLVGHFFGSESCFSDGATSV